MEIEFSFADFCPCKMLQVFTKIDGLQEIISKQRAAGASIGFVPTMGALHRGHVSLIEKSRKENDLTVVSIFVNPTQFNDKQDYTLYPRNTENDMQILDEAGCDILFLPDEQTIYPEEKFRQIDYKPGKLSERLEGPVRPGHFEGVTAVVKRLFDAVNPDKAYFGQKDYQQFLIIRDMASYYKLSLEVIMCETIREENGLAMSSRNERLKPAERAGAGLIYQVLAEAAEKLRKRNETPAAVKAWAIELLSEERNFKVEYFDICSAETLQEAHDLLDNERVLISTAVKVGDVRLIDNLLLEPKGEVKNAN